MLRIHLDFIVYRRTTNSELCFHDGYVIKRQKSAAAAIEVEKTRAGYNLGKETGLFSVPKVISYNSDSGEIRFERLYGLLSLREALAQGINNEKLIERAAKILFTIHNKLHLDSKASVSLTINNEEYDVPYVSLHGDYSLANILYSKQEDEIFIIDWSLAPWLRYNDYYGLPYIDIGIFIQALFRQRLFSRNKIENPESLMHRYVAMYCDESKQNFNLHAFKLFFPKLIKLLLTSQLKELGYTRYASYRLSFYSAVNAVNRIEL